MTVIPKEGLEIPMAIYSSVKRNKLRQAGGMYEGMLRLGGDQSGKEGRLGSPVI